MRGQRSSTGIISFPMRILLLLIILNCIALPVGAQFSGERMLVNDSSPSVQALVGIMSSYLEHRDEDRFKQDLSDFPSQNLDSRSACLYQQANGRLQEALGNPEQTFLHYRQAVQIAEQLHEKDEMKAIAQTRLAVFLMNMQSHGLAIPFFKAALPVLRKSRLPSWDQVTYNTWFRLATCFEENNLPDSAIYHSTRLIQFANEFMTARLTAASINGLGERIMRQDRCEEAMFWFDSAFHYLDPARSRDKMNITVLNRNMGNCQIRLGQVQSGLRLLQEALDLRLSNTNANMHAMPAHRIWKDMMDHMHDLQMESQAIALYDKYAHSWFPSVTHLRTLLEIWPLKIWVLQLKNKKSEADSLALVYHTHKLESTEAQLSNLSARVNLSNYIESQSQIFEQKLELQELRHAELESTLRFSYVIIILLILGVIGGLLAFYQFKRNRLLKMQKEKKEQELRTHILEIENQNLQYENQLKQREISRIAADNQVRTKTKKQILVRLNALKKIDKSKQPKELQILTNEIEHAIQFQDKMNLFQQKIDLINHDFVDNLKSAIEGITESEIELCKLIKLGFSTSEMEFILGKSNTSIRTSRYRIKNKAGISDSKAFNDFVQQM